MVYHLSDHDNILYLGDVLSVYVNILKYWRKQESKVCKLMINLPLQDSTCLIYRSHISNNAHSQIAYYNNQKW